MPDITRVENDRKDDGHKVFQIAAKTNILGATHLTALHATRATTAQHTDIITVTRIACGTAATAGVWQLSSVFPTAPHTTRATTAQRRHHNRTTQLTAEQSKPTQKHANLTVQHTARGTPVQTKQRSTHNEKQPESYLSAHNQTHTHARTALDTCLGRALSMTPARSFI